MLRHRFPRSGYVEAEDRSGHKIFYEDYGPKNAEPFVMLHGNMGYMFDMEKLSMWDLDRQRVVLIHARGIGKSQPAAELKHNLYPDLASDVETVRERLGLGRVNVVGWSGGTAVTLLYAEKHPQNCASILLYGTYLGTKEDVAVYYENMERLYPERWKGFCDHYGTHDRLAAVKSSNAAILSGDLNAVIRYKLISEPLTTGYDDILRQHTAEEWKKILGYRQVHANMLDNLFGLAPQEIERGVDKIRDVPALFVNGEHDTITPPAAAHRLADHMSKAALLVAPGADHDIHGKEAQATLRAAVLKP